MIRIVEHIGEIVLEELEHLGGAAQLALATFRHALRRPLGGRDILYELDRIGWQSMAVVGLLGLFMGMVLVVQTGQTLRRFGAEPYVSEMLALVVVRELGPVLAGFLVAGRVGSGIAAEIGSMVISEQIDAMRSLGADPVKRLVLPKVIAGIIGLPLLTAVADLIGIIGGMVMAVFMLGIPPIQYVNRIQDVLTIGDFTSGVLKTAVFGWIITAVGCYYGLQTKGGTVGVGRSATKSVVESCVLILVADLIVTSALFAIGGVMRV